MPKAGLHRGLSLFIMEINAVLDTGRYDSITLDEIKEHIRDGSIIRFMRDRTRGDGDFSSIFLEPSPYGNNFERYCVTSLQAIRDAYAGDERRKWAVSNRGLCLLIAWTVEIIKLGSGWIPGDLANVEDA
jgi:hypothetical protein